MESKEIISPTAAYDALGGQVRIECYGMATGNWSLKNCQTAADAAKPENREVLSNIAKIVEASGMLGVYAPVLSPFNHRICRLEELKEQISLPRSPICFRRGAHAEGAFVPFGEAIFITAADCAVIVGVGNRQPNGSPRYIVTAHAGLDSLSTARDGIHYHSSTVVESMYASLKSKPEDTRWFICQGIDGNHLERSLEKVEFLRQNLRVLKNLGRYGGFDLTETGFRLYITSIIKAQLARDHGVSLNDIGSDAVCTYCDKYRGSPLWWSHQRWLDGGQKGPDGRNGYLIYRRQ